MISLIAAVARHGVIGGDNRLLWHIKEDLQRFKRITTGHPVVMGRRTFESLGRPLPGRLNVVITRCADFAPEGCRTVASVEEALALFTPQQEVFIIGGEQIYRQTISQADRLYITEVDADYRGDTFFPAIDPAEWRETMRENHTCGEVFAHPFAFVDYVRVERP